jgi:nucleoside diphosphate kinase
MTKIEEPIPQKLVTKTLGHWADRIRWADDLMSRSGRKLVYKSAMPIFNRALDQCTSLPPIESNLLSQEMKELRSFLDAGSLLDTSWIVKRLRGALNGKPERGSISRPYNAHDDKSIVVESKKPEPVAKQISIWSQIDRLM